VDLDLAQTHTLIQREIDASRAIGESLARVIDYCATIRPHPDWALLRRLPFSDLYPVLEWLRRPFVEEPPTQLLRGLWFGLFNPISDSGETLADIYVSGSTRFDPDPRSNEWAVQPEWWPESRYAESEVLADVYRIAYRPDGLGNDAEYPLCLAYGALAVREALRSLPTALILGAVPSLGVAVGFDSGDFVLLGELTRNGLRPLSRAT
jgi:hypothetical protein